MKKRMKQRVTIACFGTFLSVPVAFVGAGLTGCALQALIYGMRSPEHLGWGGAFVLAGLIGLIAAAPAVLAVLVYGIAWCTPLGRHVFVSTLVPLVLGGIALVLCILVDPQDITLYGFVVAAATCVAITIAVVELWVRKGFHNRPSEPAP